MKREVKMTDPPPAGVIDHAAWESQLCEGAQEVFAMMVGTKLVRCPESGADDCA